MITRSYRPNYGDTRRQLEKTGNHNNGRTYYLIGQMGASAPFTSGGGWVSPDRLLPSVHPAESGGTIGEIDWKSPSLVRTYGAAGMERLAAAFQRLNQTCFVNQADCPLMIAPYSVRQMIMVAIPKARPMWAPREDGLTTSIYKQTWAGLVSIAGNGEGESVAKATLRHLWLGMDSVRNMISRMDQELIPIPNPVFTQAAAADFDASWDFYTCLEIRDCLSVTARPSSLTSVLLNIHPGPPTLQRNLSHHVGAYFEAAKQMDMDAPMNLMMPDGCLLKSEFNRGKRMEFTLPSYRDKVECMARTTGPLGCVRQREQVLSAAINEFCKHVVISKVLGQDPALVPDATVY
jgi:hypothetical protein